MIRPGKPTDVLELRDLLVDLHPRTRYRDVEIDLDVTRILLANAAQRHGMTNNGGSCLFVWDNGEKITAFIMGLLMPVFHIGKKLVATDVFLTAAEDTPPTVFLRLLKSYIEWAESSPRVIEIGLSWTDVIPESARMKPIYERLGFEKTGEVYAKQINQPMEMAA